MEFGLYFLFPAENATELYEALMIFSKVVAKLEQHLVQEPSDGGQHEALDRNGPLENDRSVPNMPEVQAIVNAARSTEFNLAGANELPPVVSIPTAVVNKDVVLEKDIITNRNGDVDGADVNSTDAAKKDWDKVKDSDSDSSDSDSLIPEDWIAFKYWDVVTSFVIILSFPLLLATS